jgi:beta-glucosidase
MFTVGLFDSPVMTREIDYEKHGKDALEAAEEGMVLLKNENGTLPLDPKRTKSVAIIGATAKNPRYFGGGSASTDPVYTINPYDALSGIFDEMVYAEGVELTDMAPFPAEFFVAPSTKEHGLYAQYYNNMDLSGEPALTRVDKNVYFDWKQNSPAPEVNRDNFSVRWTGYLRVPESREYEVLAVTDDGIRVWIGETKVIDGWKDQGATEYRSKVKLEGNESYELRIEYYDHTGGAVAKFGRAITLTERESMIEEARNTARGADVALVFVQDNQTEGKDQGIVLPYAQDELIRRIAEVNPNTIVILNTGGPVLMNDWIDRVPAVIEAWYGGQEMGNAIKNIITGKVNPSGKLPVTFPGRAEDVPAFYYAERTDEGYPGVDGHVRYVEGLYVGYRHYDARGIEPLFPFGYGLSYTTFECSDIKENVNKAGYGNVSFIVRNSGGVGGKEVVQLYKRSPGKDYKELIGFEKVSLMPGEQREVSFEITPDLLADYNGDISLVMSPGAYELMAGSSSRDIFFTRSFSITKGTEIR